MNISSPVTPKPLPMNYTKRRISHVVGSSLALIGFGALELNAQDEEEVFELSPFTVDSSSDEGYYASETLSGTQLKSSVRDLANPITILTDEFMDDIGAVNYEEALEFMPSTKVYYGDQADFDGNSARTGNTYVSRGFRVGALTQNFFTTNIKPDSYSTERITQSRGPNSLLFGFGSVGGALDTSFKRGRFNRDSKEFAFRMDSEGSYRGTLDVNKILMEDKLALRAAFLYEDKRTHRDLQYRRRKAAYVNFTYKPFEKTTINLNGELGRTDELNPRLYLIKDTMRGWTDSPLENHEKANLRDASGAGAQNGINGVTRNFGGNPYLVRIVNDGSPVMNWARKGHSDGRWINGQRRQSAGFVNSIVNGNLVAHNGEIISIPVTTIPSGPSDRYDVNYEKRGITLQQTITESTHLELAYRYERSDTDDYRPVRRQDFELFIDNNWYLPHQFAADNADPDTPSNPYFGLPYIESNPWQFVQNRNSNQYRATLNQQIDLTGARLGEGFDLGKISLVAMAYQSDTEHYLERQELLTTISQRANGAINHPHNRVMNRYYLTGDNDPYFPADGVQQVSQDGGGRGSIVPAVETAFLNRLSPGYTPTKTESLAFLGQWQLFNNRLILTGGTRDDDLTTQNMTFGRSTVHSGVFEGFETGTLNPESVAPVTNTNYGAVFKVHRDFDIFANESTNTVSAGNFVNVFNERLANEQGDGKDFGIRAFLSDSKYIVKLNYFENQRENSISNPLRNGLIRDNGHVERYLIAMDINGFDEYIAGSPRFADYPASTNNFWSVTEDTFSKGYELEVTMNPTKNWRMMLNVSKNDTTVNDTYVNFNAWYDQFVAPVKGIEEITSALGEDEDETIGDIIADIDGKIEFANTQVGGQQIRSNTWMANFVTSYRFSEDSMFKNFRMGGNARWKEAPSVGYAESDRNVFIADQTLKGLPVFFTDVFVTYGRDWANRDQGDWEVSLRVRNLFDDDGWFPNNAVDDGTGQPAYLQMIHQAPRTYELSGRLRF